jgi:hypothetical protein
MENLSFCRGCPYSLKGKNEGWGVEIPGKPEVEK